MRGCLAPAVLEMAFLRSERQAKAVWQPGAGNRPVTRLAATRGAHCSSSHTASVDHSSQPAASWHPQSPYVLMPGSRQSPSSSAVEPLGVPPCLPSQGAVPLPSPSSGGPHCPPPLQQPQVFWWGDRRPLRALYSYCCFYFCWMIQFLSLPSFPSFISILIVLSSLLWQACVGKCKFPRLLFFYWKTFLLEKGENGSKTTAKP